jgi:ATP-dependent Clp protease adapter protein ClpS
LRAKDLAVIESNDVKRQQILALTKQPEDNNQDTMSSFVVELLQALAPKMMETALKDEEMAKQNEALKNKLNVQEKINNTTVVDNGPKVAVNLMNDDISKRFSNG